MKTISEIEDDNVRKAVIILLVVPCFALLGLAIVVQSTVESIIANWDSIRGSIAFEFEKLWRYVEYAWEGTKKDGIEGKVDETEID